MTDHLRMISFHEWRTFPFTASRWAVYAVEAGAGIAITWWTRGSWVAWVAVAVILLADYCWTCLQVAEKRRQLPPPPPSG